MKEPAVSIKGRSSDTFEIVLREDETYIGIVTALRERVAKMRAFTGGTPVSCVVGGRALTRKQKQDVCAILEADFNCSSVTFSDEIIPAPIIEAPPEPAEKEAPAVATPDVVSKEYYDAKSMFVTQTVRSGQRIECEGDIVVLGDVNPGAELIAGGSIAVMGALRGLAHAGATGRTDVVVAANRLAPKQLRICKKAIIFPEEGGREPEVASLSEEQIVVSPIASKR